jgi:hypothetical protein
MTRFVWRSSGPGSSAELGAAVAELADEEAGQRGEVALAVGVPDVGALALDDDRDVGLVVRRHPGEVHPQVVAGRLLEGGVVELPDVGRLVDRHTRHCLTVHTVGKRFQPVDCLKRSIRT